MDGKKEREGGNWYFSFSLSICLEFFHSSLPAAHVSLAFFQTL